MLAGARAEFYQSVCSVCSLVAMHLSWTGHRSRILNTGKVASICPALLPLNLNWEVEAVASVQLVYSATYALLRGKEVVMNTVSYTGTLGACK